MPAAHLPTTAAVLDAIRASGAAAALPKGSMEFSLLAPGARLRAHCGPSNHRLRLHLPVVVPPCPERACALRVGDEARAWREGEVLVFDDSFDHEAWVDARAAGERVVLMVDVWHPELGADERAEIRAHFRWSQSSWRVAASPFGVAAVEGH